MSPMKVFGHPMCANMARVLLFLEEIGAEYELVLVDFLAGEHNSPQHAQLNPFGKVPAFQDGDLVLFESRAIVKYILRKHTTSKLDLLKENSSIEEAAMVDVWTEVESQQYYPAISPVVFECIIFPVMRGAVTNQEVVDGSLERLKKVLEVYDDGLALRDVRQLTYTHTHT